MALKPIRPRELPEEYTCLLDGHALGNLLRPVYVARLLGIRRQRVYELIHGGSLVGFRTGTRSIRITRESLIQWICEGGGSPQSRVESSTRT